MGFIELDIQASKAVWNALQKPNKLLDTAAGKYCSAVGPEPIQKLLRHLKYPKPSQMSSDVYVKLNVYNYLRSCLNY